MSRLIAPSFFCLALLGATGIALRPMPGEAATVIFPPWTSSVSALEAVAGAGASLIAADGHVVRAGFDRQASTWRLYGSGAVIVVRAAASPCGTGQDS